MNTIKAIDKYTFKVLTMVDMIDLDNDTNIIDYRIKKEEFCTRIKLPIDD